LQQSAEVKVAISLANKNPSAAINMVKALIGKEPYHAPNLAAALSASEQIDIGKLYAAITKAAPEMAIHIAEALTNASPEQAEKLVDWITTEYPEQFTNIIVAIADAMPDKGMRVIELAAENMREEHPEELLDMTEQYVTNLSHSLDKMRPVDRTAAASEQTAAELYNRLTDVSLEHSAEIALTVSEALPESAKVIAEAYVHDLIDREKKQRNLTDAEENIENAVSDYITQIAENIPEYAVDVAGSIVASVPDMASEMVELLQDSATLEMNNFSVSLDEKPKQDVLEKQLQKAVQIQTDEFAKKDGN
jgi:hypothetical protein